MPYYSLLSYTLIATLFFTACSTHQPQQDTENLTRQKMNVLFISVDDLRPELGCYGNTDVYSPNIDAIAGQGLVFQRAYCQQAVCAPSRNSILTGLRPDSLKIYDLGTNFRTTCPNVVTLPQYFKQQGYFTESNGKIYHIWHGNKDDELSWSIPPWNPWNDNSRPSSIRRNDTVSLHTSRPKYKGKLLAWNRSEFDPKYEQDSKITDHVIERLTQLKDTSFFMGVGYLKPHLPFVAPEKHWRRYDTMNVQIPDKSLPKDAPVFAMNNDGELTCCYHGFDTTSFPINDLWATEMIKGYYACVSFIDHEIGRLTTALDSLGLAENTIIVIWGDHGWKLGDYGHWCKHTAYEIDTRTTLILKVPRKTPELHTTDALVEMLDIYPTLVQEAGLPQPSHLMGKSLSHLLREPSGKHKAAALSQWPATDSIMGYSLKMENCRFIKWENRFTGKEVATELYDHEKDPKEKYNVVDEAAYQSLMVMCRKELKRIREE